MNEADHCGLRVTVSVACYRANRYVRNAVQSLLTQTHREITVVVVSDGDSDPPWPQLADIRDHRLVRFALPENHGPYFTHQVVLGASTTPFFMVHDADDCSAPTRVATLLKALITDGSDFAFSAWQQHREDCNGIVMKDSVRWRRRSSGEVLDPSLAARGNNRFLFDPLLTDDFLNRATHHGVFRREALMAIGGCYGGFRMNYDTLLTNLVLMTGRVCFVEEPLYHYLLRCDSLSHDPATGARSAARMAVRAAQAALYAEALEHYRSWAAGGVTSACLLERLRHLTARHVSPEDRARLDAASTRLSALLQP